MPKTELGNGLSIGSDSILLPNVNFKVSQYAVLFSSITSELRARGTINKALKQKKELNDEELKKVKAMVAEYKEIGLLNDEWFERISKFAIEHREDFVASKLFSRVDVLDVLIPFADKLGTQEFESKARSRLEIRIRYE